MLNTDEFTYMASCTCGKITSVRSTPNAMMNPPRCACGRRPMFYPVKGKTGARECDDRCTEGKGRSCTCTCGGANHGLAWRVRP